MGSDSSDAGRASERRSKSERKSSDKDRRRRSRSSSSSDSRKSRSRSRSPIEKDRKRKKHKKEKSSRRRSSSSSSSGSSSESSSSDSSEDRRRKKKHKKSKKRSKSKKKKEKKERKSKKKSKPNSADKSYGKYGILRPTDIYAKQGELCAWLHEVKGQDPDTIGRAEMKEHFEDYMEAYNTATLPGKKYYDLEKWTKKQIAKGESANDYSEALFNDPFAINDEELLRQERAKRRAMQATTYDRNELADMARVMRERREEEYKKAAGLEVDKNRGVRYY